MRDIQNPELWERWQRASDEADGEHSCHIDRWIPAGDIPCESPIERQLAAHLIPHAERYGFKVVEQFKLKRYRYDFAILWDDNVIALVECDGAAFHSTPAQRARDAVKDALAEQSGFAMFRYSGRDIHRNAWKCAEEIIFRLWRSA
jgi:very-short-patch-repair endonuclease